jgi:excinuclease ABC subunit B
MDNRPLKFEEFELLQNNIIYVSATPADYELEMSEGIIVEQIIRPTGLLDPKIIIKPLKNQIDDLIDEIQDRVNLKEKILVTTLTKKMAEELTSFLTKIDIRSKYIHSDVDTIERVEIMQGLREDKFDVLIGVNLLREGLDLPEVSLVAILDADKEGFLRSHRSLTQTVGRAARHINGVAILYADKMTKSINKTIEETNYRRSKQSEYNKKNNIIPKPIIKSIENPLTEKLLKNKYETEDDTIIDFVIPKKLKDFDKKIRELRKLMEKSAKELDFKSAAVYRDQIKKMKELKLSSL